MKIRKDFVTNSSSSSFIVSRKDITHGHLLDVLLEIANEEVKCEEYDWTYDWSDVTGNGVSHFRIREYDDDHPYYRCSWDDNCETKFSDVYVIDNEGCARYRWDIIDDVMNRHKLDYSIGECD